MFGMNTDDLEYGYNFEDLIEEDYFVEDDDDEIVDKDYQPSQQSMKDFEADKASDIEMGEDDDPGNPKPSSSKTGSAKKKDLEFEVKSKVAAEVAKFQNLFETSHAKYSDKQLESASWKKVAESVGLTTEVCKKHWESLKRSARYYAREEKIPSKSGAGADEVVKKYKDQWIFADAMQFYTPPSLKKAEQLVSITNMTSTTFDSDKGSIYTESLDGRSTATEDEEVVNVHVSILCLLNLLLQYLTSFYNCSYMYSYFCRVH